MDNKAVRVILYEGDPDWIANALMNSTARLEFPRGIIKATIVSEMEGSKTINDIVEDLRRRP